MIDQIRVFSKPLAACLAGIAVFMSAIQIFITAITGQHPPHYDMGVEIFIFTLGFAVIPISVFLGTKFSQAKPVAIVSFHLMLGALLVWYSEPVSPFTPIFSMTILLASIYYGWRGFISSGAFLVFICILYCFLFPNDLHWGNSGLLSSSSTTIYYAMVAMVLIMTLFTSFLFVVIIMSTRRKNEAFLKAREAEQMQTNRQATLLNSISDVVMTLNRYGRVTSQNAAAQAFFDTNESLIGRDIDKMLGLRDMSNKPVSAHALISETRSTMLRDDLSIGEGGNTRHLSLQMSRIKSTFDDSEEYGVVVIIRDITKQKSLEEEKDEFISVTSHELRTPVAIAEGSLSNLLIMEERHADPSKLRDAAKMAHDQVMYLARMINDLSTLSRAERGVGDTIEQIDVNSLLHDLFIKYTPEAQSKSLMLDLEVEPNLPKVETSRLYLEEILENFVTNALKYTKTGTITIMARNESENKIRFAVRDTGIGMSKSDLDHIFEKFYRSEDYRTRETSGTGLGLYVVSKLATKLETQIDVDSRLNHGSEFSFALPIQSAKVGAVEAVVGPTATEATTTQPQGASAPVEQPTNV